VFAALPTAAKEEMFVPWRDDPARAADLFRDETCTRTRGEKGEKTHQGVSGKKSAPYQGITWSKSTIALGLRGEGLENRVGSRSTGKERDAETGLDYFGARYYSNGLGRFISADWSATPIPVPYAHFDDPQTLNQYSYVRNIPTSLEDADGHGILEWLKQGACSVGFSSQCAAPPPQDKKQLVNAQDSARSNPALQPKGNTTHCNAATCQIVKQTGAPLDPLVDKNGKPTTANQQAQNLANSNQYREVTPKEAQQIANNGGTVIVAYDNPNGHGHTATVRPEGVPGDNPPKGGRGPLINDIGRNVGVHNENYTFRKGTEVHYYAPKDKP
jgi:RHS repeat-associated protein